MGATLISSLMPESQAPATATAQTTPAASTTTAPPAAQPDPAKTEKRQERRAEKKAAKAAAKKSPKLDKALAAADEYVLEDSGTDATCLTAEGRAIVAAVLAAIES